MVSIQRGLKKEGSEVRCHASGTYESGPLHVAVIARLPTRASILIFSSICVNLARSSARYGYHGRARLRVEGATRYDDETDGLLCFGFLQ